MTIDDLDTPAVLVDVDILARNIERAQLILNAANMSLRPHIKTHKIPSIAAMQQAAGAQGIACQKLSEAEVFADAGFTNILLCYNIMGAAKLERLVALNRRVDLTVVADSPYVVAGLSAAFAEEKAPLRVLAECDTGLGRCGVQTPDAACSLAIQIESAPGLSFAGLMTYPAPGTHAAVQKFLAQAKALCLSALGKCDIVSSGGTPSLSEAALAPVVTEYRPGTYVYNDRSLVARGACSLADCALTVLSRVVSVPTPDRAIIDAGSKSLSSDLLGLNGYGMLPVYPEARIIALSEEHGHIDLSDCATRPLTGELVQVLPNHACPVSNLASQIHLHRGNDIVETLAVSARGRVH